MVRRCRKLPTGFTLIELLVVISIIGMLAALLLPAVNAAREAGRRSVCNSSQRQLCLATLNFESGRNRFPGSRENLGGNPASGGGVAYPISWIVALMPNMERNDIYDAFQTDCQTNTNPPTGGTPQGLPTGLLPPYTTSSGGPYIKVLRCPSDPPLSINATQSYICNAGYVSADSPNDGLFLDQIPTTGMNPYVPQIVRTSSIYDGQSNTLMLSENLLAQVWYDVSAASPGSGGATGGYKISNCFVYQQLTDGLTTPKNPNVSGSPSTMPSPALMKINGGRLTPQAPVPIVPPISSVNLLRPSSNHPAGVNSGFADGHTQFLRDNMPYYVLQQLMTPNYKKSIYTPLYYVLQDSDFE